MIDCHTHLTHPDFDPDRDTVLAQARAAGVSRVAVVGQDLAENEGVLRLAQAEAGVLPFLGLHPDRFADRAEPVGEDEIAAIEAQIRHEAPRLTGIGEVGLDRWVCRDEARLEAQRHAFERMVALALELDLPLNVHSRSAGHHTIDLLIAHGATRVLMHAFDGKGGHAQRGAEAGFVFSIPPSIVRSQQKQKLVRALPLTALALETDSPVLGPEAGQRNVPANVRLSLEAIAEIKRLPVPEVAAQLEANTRALFRLDAA